MPLTDVPVNRPLSSVTVGPADVAKIVVAAAQIAIRDTQRKVMIARENGLRVPRVDL